MSHTPLKASIIMVDGNFREKFHAIPFFAEQTLSPNDYEIIWVNYFAQIPAPLATHAQNYPHVQVVALDKTGEYHSSYCFNEGIKRARGEVIIIPDADLVAEPDFIQRVLDEHAKNDQLVMYIYRYNESEKEHQPNVTLSHLQKVGKLTNPYNYGGCLSVKKKWLTEINGYEQHPLFAGELHGNGYDVYSRLRILGLHIAWHPTLKLYHPWHPMTSIASVTYDIHHAISDYRAKHLLHVAFMGINPTHDTPVPADLITLTTTMQTNFDRQNRRYNSLFQRGKRKIGKWLKKIGLR